MKTLRTTVVMMAMAFTSLLANAQPMTIYSMRSNARFLTDRMAYTLGLNPAILDDLYCINYDYICGVNDYLDQVALGYRYDDYMEVLYARDYALRRLLNESQWALLMTYDYFYRPIAFANHHWRFAIYAHDHRMNYFFFNPPRRFNEYRGGVFFGGMRRINDGMRGGDMRRGQVGAPGRFVPQDGRGNMNYNGNGFHIGDPGRNNQGGQMNRDNQNIPQNRNNRDNQEVRNNQNRQIDHNNQNNRFNGDMNNNGNQRTSTRNGGTTVNRNYGGTVVNTRNNTMNTRTSSTRSYSNTNQQRNMNRQTNTRSTGTPSVTQTRGTVNTRPSGTVSGRSTGRR